MSRHLYYKLDPVTHEVTPTYSWAVMSAEERQVAKNYIGPYCISTVFLQIDHSFTDGGKPVVFETMIFGEEEDQPWSESYCERYSTWDEAVEGHKKAVEEVQARLKLHPERIVDRFPV